MQIRTISDTHGKHRELDIIECDMLIHAGDISTTRNPIENAIIVRDFID
jgi:predicted phosphodiesterase